ncbi:type II toxin-antitoxin system RelE/ParE family toxin [Treponema parvum]|uniref:type II toxin-antitoxin system RelE/ParE family toxin n=1 Tax=Treponema parvum TaxID=138851 RepID=UPI001AEC2450|nr:type II toxin-antitoxin system RelE/ParE family toxin [Treponema parvum]QTQ17161.1 type II toxin-antitoxin system RelE/ParE family toxin [Treponema parvum]
MANNWIVEFYETKAGEKPSLDFINTLEVKLKAKVFRDLGLLENRGNELRLPYSQHLDDGIFELRTIQGNNIVMHLYFFIIEKKIIITHGFRKKAQKTPPSEIQRAKDYRTDYLNRNLEAGGKK